MKQKMACPNCGMTFLQEGSEFRSTCPFCAFRIVANQRTEDGPGTLRIVDDDEARLVEDDEAQLLDDDEAAQLVDDAEGKLVDDEEARLVDDSTTNRGAKITSSQNSPKRKHAKLQTFGQVVLLGGLVWFFLGLPLALAMPRLTMSGAFLRGLLTFVQMVVTPVLIFLNLSEAVRQVGRTGKVLAALPHTLAQLLLFPLLFFEIFCIFGASSYSFEKSPTGLDWVLFAVVHAFRAADVVDTVQVFQIDVLSIRSNSTIVSSFLILYHVVVDFFMAALLIRGYEHLRRRQQGGLARHLARNPEEVVLKWRAGNIALTKGWFALWGVFFLFWAPTALLFSPWSWGDMLRWPLDNCIRVVDFLDLMDLGSIRLHGRTGLWDASLAFFFRLLVAGVLIRLLSAVFQTVSLRWLGGFGLDERSLEEISLTRRDELGDAARERLAVLLEDHGAKELALNPTRWLPLEGWLGVLTALLVAILPSIFLSRWDGVVYDLASAAVDLDEPRAARAVEGLERFGRRAEKAIPKLIEGLPKLPAERQRDVVRLLPMLGAEGRTTSARYLFSPDAAFAEAALSGLSQSGDASASDLFQASLWGHASIRESAKIAVRKMGKGGIRPVLNAITEKDALLALPILDEMDPDWPNVQTENQLARRIQSVVRARRTLQMSNSALDLAHAAKALGNEPQFAKLAEKDLLNILERDSFSLSISERVGIVEVDVRKEVEKALTSISAFELQPLISLLESKDVRQVRSVLVRLRALGPSARGALAPLQSFQTKAPVGLQDHVRDCIAAISPSTNTGRGTGNNASSTNAENSPNNAATLGRGPASGEAPPAWGEWTPVGRGTVWVALPKGADVITEVFYPIGDEQKKYGWRVKLSVQGIRMPVHLEGTEAEIKQKERKRGITRLLGSDIESLMSAHKLIGKQIPWAPGFPDVLTQEFFGAQEKGATWNYRWIGLADASKIFRFSAAWHPSEGDDTRSLGAIMNSLRVDPVK